MRRSSATVPDMPTSPVMPAWVTLSIVSEGGTLSSCFQRSRIASLNSSAV
jgi:hypothetical protein